MNDYQASPNLVAHVKQSEKLMLVPYVDVAGYLTGGWGHKYAPGEYVPPALTEDQAEAILAGDLSRAGAGVRRLVTVQITQGQFDGLTDFVFNLGEFAFAGSSMLQMVNAENFGAAAVDCKQWDHAHVGGHLVELAGLKIRRAWDAECIDPDEPSVVWTPGSEVKADTANLGFPLDYTPPPPAPPAPPPVPMETDPLKYPVLMDVVPDPNLQQAIETPPVP